VVVFVQDGKDLQGLQFIYGHRLQGGCGDVVCRYGEDPQPLASIPSTWSDKVIDSGEAVGEARLVAAGTGVAGGGVE